MGWQVVQYVVVVYSNIVVYGDGIEFFCYIICSFNILGYQLVYVF